MADPDIDDIERRMKGAVDALQHEFAGLRTGRANASMLDPISVDAYGSKMPINQLGTVGVPEPRLLTVQVWDNNLVGAVEKAIASSGLGVNPAVDGQLIRIPIPELSEERRVEMTKIASRYAEQSRVAVRNVRRDGMETLKKLEKEGEIGEDEHKAWAEEIQQMTDKFIDEIDRALESKEQEIMQV